MSYLGFIKSEMEIINADMSVLPMIERILRIIDGEGHSGASIGIFSGWFKNWAANPEPITDKDSMLYPISEVVKDLDIEQRKTLLHYCVQGIRFNPLSPLTGADDEWVFHKYGDEDEGLYQNRRMGSVWKDIQGRAHRNEMVIWSYPGSDYSYWSSYTRGGGKSSVEISFPYDPGLPENQPRSRFFFYDGWEHELPADIDADAWLTSMHQIWLRGIHPQTACVREAAMFVHYYEFSRPATNDQATFFDRLVSLLCYLKYNPEAQLKRTLDRLRWLADDGESFVVEWTEADNETDDVHHFKKVIGEKDIGYALARMLSSIPTEWQYMVSGQQFFGDNPDSWEASLFWDPTTQQEHRLDWRPVFVTTRQYQRWIAVKPNTAYFDPKSTGHLVDVAVPEFVVVGKDAEPFFYDQPYQVVGDADDYLYRKRREHGFSHPRTRDRLVLDKHAMAETPPATDLTQGGPIGYVPPLDSQESEQIDNVVAKHVGQVFGNKKKD